MLFLASTPDIAPITDLITTWIHIGQALVGSVGALAFFSAVMGKRGAMRSKRQTCHHHRAASVALQSNR